MFLPISKFDFIKWMKRKAKNLSIWRFFLRNLKKHKILISKSNETLQFRSIRGSSLHLNWKWMISCIFFLLYSRLAPSFNIGPTLENIMRKSSKDGGERVRERAREIEIYPIQIKFIFSYIQRLLLFYIKCTWITEWKRRSSKNGLG